MVHVFLGKRNPVCSLSLSLVFIVGLLMFYCLLVLLYTAGISLYAHRVWITINKGGPMHEVSSLLTQNQTALLHVREKLQTINVFVHIAALNMAGYVHVI